MNITEKSFKGFPDSNQTGPTQSTLISSCTPLMETRPYVMRTHVTSKWAPFKYNHHRRLQRQSIVQVRDDATEAPALGGWTVLLKLILGRQPRRNGRACCRRTNLSRLLHAALPPEGNDVRANLKHHVRLICELLQPRTDERRIKRIAN